MSKKLEPPPVVRYEAMPWYRIRKGDFYWTGTEWANVPSHACLFWLPEYAKTVAAGIPKKAKFAVWSHGMPKDGSGPVVVDVVEVRMKDTVVTTAVDVSKGGAPKTRVKAKLVVENFAYLAPDGRQVALDRPKTRGGAK